MSMKRTHIFLPDPVVSALKSVSEKTGLSVAEHIRRAVAIAIAIDTCLKKQ